MLVIPIFIKKKTFHSKTGLSKHIYYQSWNVLKSFIHTIFSQKQNQWEVVLWKRIERNNYSLENNS
jgi:hypothetical protein